MSNETFSKTLYKIFSIVSKFSPILLFIIQIISLFVNFLGIKIYILSHIAGSSILFMLTLLLISYVFKYCYLHRIPIWGNIIIGILCMLRKLDCLPVDLINLYRIFAFIISFIIALYVVVAYKTRNNPKVDHFKEFCKGCCK